MPDDSVPLPATGPLSVAEDHRTGLGKEALKQAFLDNLFCMQGKFPALATKRDCYLALADFHAMWPERFSNKTNGVTPRRCVVLANPGQTGLIVDAIGDEGIKDLGELRRLEPLADDAGFRARWRAVKHANKERFAAYVRQRTGIVIDPGSLFDVQAERTHEYKRQHLNILHVIARYARLRANPDRGLTPRTFIFGGKAAPGCQMAKLVVKLIHATGEFINRDPVVRDRLKLVFLPNFNVSSGERVHPAADLSEPISTAGKEASGTGNMKFAMNGARSIGTLDRANIEIRDEVGAEHFFLFGLTAREVSELRIRGYRPLDHCEAHPERCAVIDLLRAGFFSRGDTDLFRPLLAALLADDHYLALADFAAYAQCQQQVGQAYNDAERWARMSILNAARSGRFSSDRTIREYCEEIWRVKVSACALFKDGRARGAGRGGREMRYPCGLRHEREAECRYTSH